ncbi:hypothetical protein KGF57_003889 [Candida theae]|uniref:E3 ubiquitin-protein ligase listerin n=1 Tax=Candida theae TaxID=1198502 RepID=A0AAD5BCM3_9ASCO|nr:uncharacterized protein KGF57_003889 [Candida theae]KAI5954864.1 hypothetical protein KGF57_003889 [Candida theae]
MSEGFTGNLGFEGLDVTLNYFTNQPDVSSVTNADLAIIFKSLSKKDPKTKERALGDLLAFIEKESVGFNDLDIECWVKMYPKIALDNSKDVRAMTHRIQGTLLKTLGSKIYGKYLKITMPIWLLGIKDPDKGVSKTASSLLLENFSGDKSKFEKVWEIFENQILNLIGSVVTIETPETLSDPRYVSESEIQIKYDRVLSVCIEMLLQICKKSEYTASIESILKSDTIWDSLVNSVKDDSMNLGLFKYILTLILNLFSVESHLLESMDYKSLYKTVSKAIMKVKYSKNSPSIIYSAVILPFWQVLIQLTRFSKRMQLNKSIWDIGGSKAITRLHNYTRLGPCDSDPVYYDLAGALMTDLKGENVVDFNDSEESVFFTKTLVMQMEKNRETFKPSCLRCTLKVLDLFDTNKVENTTTVIQSVLEGKSYRLGSTAVEITSKFENFENKSLLKESLSVIVADIKANAGDKLYTKEYLTRLYELLKVVGLKDQSAELVDSVLKECAAEKIDVSVAFRYAAAYFTVSEDITPSLKSFVGQIPQQLQGNYETLIEIIKHVTSKKLLEDEILVNLINESFSNLSLTNPEKRDAFVKSIDSNFTESEYPEIYSYLKETSRGSAEPEYLERSLASRDDNALRDVIDNLDEQSSPAFISAVLKTDSLAYAIELGIDGLLQSAWGNAKQSSQFLKTLSQHDVAYFSSLVGYLQKCSIETRLDDVVSLFREGPLLFERFCQYVKESVNNTEPYEFAIANALESAVYLCTHGPKRLSKEILLVAKFIIELNIEERNWRALTSICKEIVSDFVFTEDIHAEEEQVLMEVVEKASRQRESVNLKDLIGDNSNDPLTLIADGDDIFAFYAARCLSKTIENASEQLSLSQFESLEINYVQLFKHPLKCVALTNGIKNFLGSSKLDRPRNHAFSELLAVKKEEDIITLGLKWITILISFINKEANLKNIFPGIKLSMVLKQIDDWFDTSAAYDPEFIDVRIQTFIFLGHLPDIEDALPDIYYDLVNKVLSDNLDMAEDRIDLRYDTLKVYTSLLKYNLSGIELQDEKIIELLTSEDEHRGHVVSLVDAALERAVQTSNISTKLVKSSQDQLLKTLAQTSSIIRQKLCVMQLTRLFKEEKDDFVIEYQLSKDESKKAELPLQVMKIMQQFKVDSTTDVFRYMFSWLLITDFFKDVTLSIKNDYLNQVLEGKDLQTLLFYIFDHVDLDNKFLSTLDIDEVTTYDVQEIFNGTSVEEELKILSLCIYYKLLKYCGFQVQLWFKEIRDKQLQMKVERITSKYLSPPLINEVLEQVESEKKKLLAKEDNLSIKVNRVSNEIKTSYLVDEQKLEMVVKIPPHYPLENVVIDGPSRVGVKENRWKAWLLASQKLISLQNGSISDAIELFCKNINLHFSGFEDCAICYSILHQDLSLPSKTCQTCNNKFHAACLYKWFKSSGNSTCPLCRSPFNFKTRS